MTISYRLCTRCVMDTSDPDISFDEQGVCSHCRQYDLWVREHVFTGEEGRRRLHALAQKIKKEGASKPYDCIIGVSGGIDSTYTAYKVKELGLRPLAVHLDNGWDSELAVHNISKTLDKLGIDLHTHVIDWEEFRDLQLAFLYASTPDSEIPSDHAIFALMRHTARKHGIRTIITGENFRTETHLPRAWSQGHSDWRYIASVHKQFGSLPRLRTYPYMGFWTYHTYLRTQRRVQLLDYVDYVKEEAKQIVERELGWEDYGGKHYESIYTRFYQGYILPVKFGFDKRRSHLSSLICSGEIRRGEALEMLEDEPYPAEMQREDREYVIKKLGIDEAEFERIMTLPPRSYWDYPSYGEFYKGRIFRLVQTTYRRLQARNASTP